MYYLIIYVYIYIYMYTYYVLHSIYNVDDFSILLILTMYTIYYCFIVLFV